VTKKRYDDAAAGVGRSQNDQLVTNRSIGVRKKTNRRSVRARIGRLHAQLGVVMKWTLQLAYGRLQLP